VQLNNKWQNVVIFDLHRKIIRSRHNAAEVATSSDCQQTFECLYVFLPANIDSQQMSINNISHQRLNVDSATVYKNYTNYMYKKLSYRRETARQLRIHAQLTRCFSAVAV